MITSNIDRLIEEIKRIEHSIMYTMLNYGTDIVFQLSDDDFYSDSCKKYFKAIKDMAQSEHEINAITVADTLKRLGTYENGDLERLISLQTSINIIAGTGTVKALKTLVKQYKAYLKTIELQQEVLNAIAFGEEISPEIIEGKFQDFLEEEHEEDIVNKSFYKIFYNKQEENWLCNQLIYRDTINVLTGFGSIGKTYLALQLAISAILLKPFLLPIFHFTKPEPGVDNLKVLFLTVMSENPIELLLRRIHSIMNGLKLTDDEKETVRKNFILVTEPEVLAEETFRIRGLNTTDFYGKIKRLIKTKKIDLVIIDPVARFVAVNENDNHKWSWFYNQLEKIPTTWLLIHHPPKSDMGKNNGDPLTARGASAKREHARTHLVLKKGVLHIEKCNFSMYDNHYITLTGPYPEGFFSATVSTLITAEEFAAITKNGNGKRGSNGNARYKKATM